MGACAPSFASELSHEINVQKQEYEFRIADLGRRLHEAEAKRDAHLHQEERLQRELLDAREALEAERALGAERAVEALEAERALREELGARLQALQATLDEKLGHVNTLQSENADIHNENAGLHTKVNSLSVEIIKQTRVARSLKEELDRLAKRTKTWRKIDSNRALTEIQLQGLGSMEELMEYSASCVVDGVLTKVRKTALRGRTKLSRKFATFLRTPECKAFLLLSDGLDDEAPARVGVASVHREDWSGQHTDFLDTADLDRLLLVQTTTNRMIVFLASDAPARDYWYNKMHVEYEEPPYNLKNSTPWFSPRKVKE